MEKDKSIKKNYINKRYMETVTIPKEEYLYLKRLEEVAQAELLASVRRGLNDALQGRVRQR